MAYLDDLPSCIELSRINGDNERHFGDATLEHPYFPMTIYRLVCTAIITILKVYTACSEIATPKMKKIEKVCSWDTLPIAEGKGAEF